MGPTERMQAVSIARQYYREGLSKIEIADLHGLSRYKVARILEKCVETGIVKIEINADTTINMALSEQLAKHFKLKHALVVDGTFEDIASTRHALGRSAATLLMECLTAEDVLGVAWGRTIDQISQEVKDLPSCSVVQMTGVTSPVQANSVDLVRRMAVATQGPAYPIYAPLLVSDHEALLAIQRQAEVREAMAYWSRITVAVVAIGSWCIKGSQLYEVLSKENREELEKFDVAWEFCGILMDADGAPVKTSLTERTVGVPYEILRNIPEVIAVAGGMEKVEAIRLALKSRLVSSLVTDATVARALLMTS